MENDSGLWILMVFPRNGSSPFFCSFSGCLMEVRLLQSVLCAPAVLLPAQQTFGEIIFVCFILLLFQRRSEDVLHELGAPACHIKSYRMAQETFTERSEISNFEATLRFGLGKGTLIHVRLERGCWLPGLLVQNSAGELLYQMHFTEIQEEKEEQQQRDIPHKKLKILCLKS